MTGFTPLQQLTGGQLPELPPTSATISARMRNIGMSGVATAMGE
jgi:hypothetical protein